MQGSEVSRRHLYVIFLGQVGSRTLQKIIENAPESLWQIAVTPTEVSPTLQEFKESFWREVTRNWESGSKVKLSVICEGTKRTPKYWSSYFLRHPEALIWVLAPLEEVVRFEPLVRGVILKSLRVLGTNFSGRNGSVSTREARIVTRLLEIIYSRC